MIRISEADYAAAMSDHHRYIREAERLGPIWFELRQRRAKVGRSQRIRDFVSKQLGAISALLSTPMRLRRQSAS